MCVVAPFAQDRQILSVASGRDNTSQHGFGFAQIEGIVGLLTMFLTIFDIFYFSKNN